jgi:hypothetical protein
MKPITTYNFRLLPQTTTMPLLDLQSFCYDDRDQVLPQLLAGFTDCGGWILDRRTLSSSIVEFRIEVQLRSIIDLYASVIASGLELTRYSHLALTDLCTCRKNAAALTDLGQLVTLRIEINFLEELTLHSLLASGNALA